MGIRTQTVELTHDGVAKPLCLKENNGFRGGA